MSEMVERVVAAMKQADAGIEGQVTPDEFNRIIARAAIAAMRDPTKAMLEAALLWEDGDEQDFSDEWYPYGNGAWLRDYRKLIDIALQEPSTPPQEDK